MPRDLTPAFLDVEASLSGRRWVGPGADEARAASRISQVAGLEASVAAVLARRGIEAEDATAFLAPTLRELMPDPSVLKDMDTAIALFCDVVRAQGRIAVFADYDVDGGSSAALLLDWLGQQGLSATLYIPDRIDEGYGPNVPAMEQLARGHDLIICVDCGTLSHEPIAAARAAGAQVIVLDHHQGGEILPDAGAVVNPNRQDEDCGLGYLCAAGVVFLMLAGANRALRAERSVPDLMAMLDLVALATVADVAPLIGFNRALVRQGLSVMARRERAGLVALGDVAGLSARPTAYHLGFMLGPRVNAGGRIGAADLGARLLATRDPHEAAAMAERLDALNKERREIEAQVLAQAMEQAEARGTDGALVWAAGQGWHPGVVGIVAARLKEATNRPAVVIGLEAGVGKGSARSVTGVDLGAAVAACTREGLLTKGGGHAMAAGLTVDEEKIDAAMERLSELLAKQGAAAIGPKDLRLDGLLTTRAAQPDLVEALDQAGPFGAGAPAPRHALAAQRISFAKRAGENHLRLTFADDSGGRLDAICFRAFDGPLGPALENHGGAKFHVAGRLEIDEWGGRRKAKLRLEDAAPVA
ncbi:single-stranded-DNA-specific exonuclease RecJ [Pontivivens insulae]|uniref:Single-stranded-DNA-specific exonuclease RecJ n=1 Tax=Pontivivens insulae TaxID=1639689 RepID=A0A2R8AEG0_9RHOB|nr:single-stranded-DNA-specific exonuclease RecJ [Pontivivens insulae]RED14353.1 exonuclease RecJ [Pontivivens insulae]SPF30430.1 Single-stranded-DNA-specific exonuclease RecJ [Pontivivens insulae]